MALTLVDAHVHFYRPFDAWAGIDAAAENFSRARLRLSLPPDGFGVLMFVRSKYEGPLRELRARLSSDVPEGWTLDSDSDEDPDWLSVSKSQTTIYVVEGQQVRTSNGLEVLALARGTDFEDGQPFATTLDGVLQSGAVTVIPWGFGKWLGRRGREVEDALARRASGALFLGDNSSRPGPCPEPALFRSAREQGVFVLPGTDPMPVPREESSIGRFGFVLDGFDPGDPVGSLSRSLHALGCQPQVYGERDSLLASVYKQVRLRLVRRAASSATIGARA